MAIVPPARSNIEQESVDFRSPISEAVLTNTAASLNFVNLRQHDLHCWHLNGAYALGEGLAGPDGIYAFLFDAEIVGWSIFNGKTGFTTPTIIDVHRLSNGDTDDGSIFTTRPQVDITAADSSYSVRDELNTTTIVEPTGHTVGVIDPAFINVDAGQAVRLDLDSAMKGGNNFQFCLYFRPR